MVSNDSPEVGGFCSIIVRFFLSNPVQQPGLPYFNLKMTISKRERGNKEERRGEERRGEERRGEERRREREEERKGGTLVPSSCIPSIVYHQFDFGGCGENMFHI